MFCSICSSSMSESVQELFALPSVASDCRPWSNGRSVQICSGCGVMKRVISNDFNHDVYKKYTSYPEPTGRTAKVLEFIKDRMPAPNRVLDIGAGDGHGMRVMEDFFPDAMVLGYEPTINSERPYQKFDLITLFHVFEHVEDLHEMLAYIKFSLTENGHVLIQVPYAAMWPFDLIIADHEWHFNMISLRALLHNSEWSVVYVGNEVIGKEITLLAYPAKINEQVAFDEQWINRESIDWLLNFKSNLDGINERVAVYGTSVSAMWAGNILGDKVVMYLDDDNNRLGEFNGKPVANPYLCALPIVAPFPDWQMVEIKEKHPGLKIL